MKNKFFFFAGIERVRTNSSEVLGISNYWRQFVTDTIVPTGQRSTVGLVKVDLNVDTNNRGYVRYTNTHKRDFNVPGTSPGSLGPLNTLESRQTFGGPLWNVLGNWTTTLSNRAFNEARVSLWRQQAVDSEQPRRRDGRRELLDGRWLQPDERQSRPATFASISYPGATFGATSFTGLEGEGNLFVVDNFSIIIGRHQFKVGAQVTRSRMFMDVEASHKGRWTFTQDRLFDINDPIQLSGEFQRQHRHGCGEPGGVESVVLCAGHVAADQQPDLQPRLPLRPRQHADHGQPVRRSVQRSASSRGWAARRRCRSRWPTRTTLRRGSASSGCRPRTAR